MKAQQIGSRNASMQVFGYEFPVVETLWRDSKGLFYTMESDGIETVTVRVVGNASIDGLWGEMNSRIARRHMAEGKGWAA